MDGAEIERDQLLLSNSSVMNMNLALELSLKKSYIFKLSENMYDNMGKYSW